MSNGATQRRVWVRPAQFCDLKPVSDLRQADRDEILASGRDPVQALLESYEASKPHVFTVLIDGKPEGIFGVAPGHAPCCGIPWMLGTERLTSSPRDLVVQGRFWVEYLNSLYHHLSNYVHADNHVSIRWLQLMGFEFELEDTVTLPKGQLFRRFTRDV